MSYLFIRHRVADYDRWKSVYDADREKREAATLTERHLFRDAEDPNQVVLLFEVGDLDRALAFSRSDDLQQVMNQAGVLGGPEVLVLDDVAGAPGVLPSAGSASPRGRPRTEPCRRSHANRRRGQGRAVDARPRAEAAR